MKIWNWWKLRSEAYSDAEPSESSLLELAVEFAENPEPRCPCVLLLDTSATMQGEAIQALNQGLQTFKQELNHDNLARKRVEVAIITYNSNVAVVQDFITADEFEPPTLTARGKTCMGSAILQGLELLAARKAQYCEHGVAYYQPWLFLIANGKPQGEPDQVINLATQQIKADEAERRLTFFVVGVTAASQTHLSEIFERKPMQLEGLSFADLFVWLSASMHKVSQSSLNQQLPSPP